MIIMLCITELVIIYYFRTNIESSYGQQVTHLREQYTREDKELIKEALGAKGLTTSSEKSEPPTLTQKILIEEELGKTIVGKFYHSLLSLHPLTLLPLRRLPPHVSLPLSPSLSYAHSYAHN